jgi:hypothetical protein
VSEEFIILYVLDRVGNGAESYLYRPDDDPGSQPPVLRHQLDSDQLLVFEDKRYKHDTTPPQCAPEGTARRDVLVCTVDFRSPYLGASALDEATEL